MDGRKLETSQTLVSPAQDAASFVYNSSVFKFDNTFLQQQTQLRPLASMTALAGVWVSIAALVLSYRLMLPLGWQIALYVPTVFFIAGRMGALLQLLHEAAHKLLLPNEYWNNFVANWFCAHPVGLSLEGYGPGHLRHHAYTGTERDPKSDTEKYRITDVRNPGLWKLMLKDIAGITALQMFFAYRDNETSGLKVVSKASAIRSKMGFFLALGVAQAVILLLLFQGNVFHYLLLWAFPAMGPHMVLMRVRGIAEHGLFRQVGAEVSTVSQGTFYTRSFLTPVRQYGFMPMIWLEKALIGSMSVHYHHEHHLLPGVPFYNLRNVHAQISLRVREMNPETYCRGYFSAFLRSIFKGPR